jgi:hypothetical protein
MRSSGRPKGGRRSKRCEGASPCRRVAPTTAGASYIQYMAACSGGWFDTAAGLMATVGPASCPCSVSGTRPFLRLLPPRRLELAARTDACTLSPTPVKAKRAARGPSQLSRPLLSLLGPSSRCRLPARSAVGPCYLSSLPRRRVRWRLPSRTSRGLPLNPLRTAPRPVINAAGPPTPRLSRHVLARHQTHPGQTKPSVSAVLLRVFLAAHLVGKSDTPPAPLAPVSHSSHRNHRPCAAPVHLLVNRRIALHIAPRSTNACLPANGL